MMLQLAAHFVILIVGQRAQAHGSADAEGGAACAQVVLPSRAVYEGGIQLAQGAVFPHLDLRVPSEGPMADVVWGCDAANLAAAVTRHAAGVTAVEEGGKIAVIR